MLLGTIPACTPDFLSFLLYFKAISQHPPIIFITNNGQTWTHKFCKLCFVARSSMKVNPHTDYTVHTISTHLSPQPGNRQCNKRGVCTSALCTDGQTRWVLNELVTLLLSKCQGSTIPSSLFPYRRYYHISRPKFWQVCWRQPSWKTLKRNARFFFFFFGITQDLLGIDSSNDIAKLFIVHNSIRRICMFMCVLWHLAFWV